ncbi:MAG: electron transfer flavoprotein subunit beta/FixA family protein [Dehalococcoidia bacterium]|jgi:electron transfer flavoprotein beta subunit
MPLHIIACVKQVPDPEAPASSFRVDEAAKKVIAAAGVAPVISQFDALAVEAALRIKDAAADTKVTVVSLGPEGARDVIKHSLAMGADEGVLLTDGAFEGDSYTTALALSKAIEKIGDYNLVLCGRQATDWDAGVVGYGIAELLGVASVSLAKAVTIQDGKVVVERVLMEGYDTVEAPLPALVTVSNELGEPRYPKLQQIMMAARKQVTVWGAGDIGFASSGVRANLERLFQPVSEVECEVVEGETPDEAAQKLAQRLRDQKII